MKYLLIIFLCFGVTKTFSQSKIRFAIDDDKIRANSDLVNLPLPIEFAFHKDYKDKTISILNDSDETILLKKFGQNDLKILDGESDYIIQILSNGSINLETDNDVNIKNIKKLKIKINDLKRFVLTFDKTSGGKIQEESYKTGYIYYDVMRLLEYENDIATVKTILASYGINSSNYESNPFIKDVFDDQIKQTGAQAGGSLLTNLGNTDVTYFAAGLARFLAERTKEELNEAFFRKMKEKLNSYPELTTVFPNTSQMLNIIETYSYASVLQVLKEAFETDVQNLPGNLYNIKDLTEGDCDKMKLSPKDSISCQERLKKLTEFFATQDGHWVALGMYSVKEAIQSTNPAELLRSIVSSSEFTSLKTTSITNKKYDDYNIASSIELSNFISRSLISKTENQVWITPKQLDSLFTYKQGKAFEVYLGLLLSFEQRENDPVIIKFYNERDSMTFGEILDSVNRKYNVYKPQVVSLIKNSYTVYNATNNAVKKMIAASEKSTEVEPQALYNYYRTFTASLKPIAHSPILDSLLKIDIGVEYDKVEKFLNPSVDIAYHISTKKYSAAIYDASILLSNLDTVFSGFKPVTKSFVKYGTFISTVANAQSSEEVKQALDASVLPAGSYSIKRNTNWSISINSYVGAFWSYSNTLNTEDHLLALGLAAPVGVNFSKGFSKTGKCGGVSLNVQIFDLGALVNYYLLKGDTASIPDNFKVRLSNVFSPGFNLCYNIPMTPLSFAWGAQYIPTLYKYEQIDGVNELTPTNALRWQLSLLVDIPLYNINVWDFNK